MSWWRMALNRRSVWAGMQHADRGTARLRRRVLQWFKQRWRALVAATSRGEALVASPAVSADPTLVELPPLPRMAYVGEVRFVIECNLAADVSLMVRLWQMETQAVYAWVWVDGTGQVLRLTLDEQADSSLERAFRQRLVGIRLDAPPPPSLRWPILLRLDWGHGASVSASGPSSVTPGRMDQ